MLIDVKQGVCLTSINKWFSTAVVHDFFDEEGDDGIVFLLGVGAEDVDCAGKVGDADVAAGGDVDLFADDGCVGAGVGAAAAGEEDGVVAFAEAGLLLGREVGDVEFFFHPQPPVVVDGLDDGDVGARVAVDGEVGDGGHLDVGPGGVAAVEVGLCGGAAGDGDEEEGCEQAFHAERNFQMSLMTESASHLLLQVTTDSTGWSSMSCSCLVTTAGACLGCAWRAALRLVLGAVAGGWLARGAAAGGAAGCGAARGAAAGSWASATSGLSSWCGRSAQTPAPRSRSAATARPVRPA